MTLLIAYLLIHHTGVHWAWYIVATGVYLLHLDFHNSNTN